MDKGFIRKLIDIEIRLGFLHIPSHGVEIMPNEKTKVDVFLDDRDKLTSLSYNSSYRRLFGLTSWYKKHNAKPGDEVKVKILNKQPSFIYKFNFRPAEKLKDQISEEKEAKELIDLSGVSSVSKGDIVEDRIKDLIILYGQGLLNVYKPVSDTEGIDLIVVKSGTFQPIFIQVKGRFALRSHRAILVDINLKTFNPHHSYFVVAAYFNPATLEIDDNILLIPTKEIKENAIVISTRNIQRCRVINQLDPESRGKWAKFVIKKSELANKLLEKFQEIETYFK